MSLLKIILITLLILTANSLSYSQSLSKVIVNESHYSEIAQIDICANGQFAISQAEQRDDVTNAPLKLWDLSTARLLRNLKAIDYTLSPDTNILYLNQSATNKEAANLQQPLIILDLESLTQITNNYKYRVNKISSNGRLALSYDLKGVLHKNAFIFELENGQKKIDLPGELLSIADDFSIALLRENQQTKIYDITHNSWLTTLISENSWLSQNGQTAISIDKNNLLYIWKKTTNKTRTLQNYPDCLALSYDGNQSLFRDENNKLKLLNLETNKSTPIDIKDTQICKIAFTKNSKQLVILSHNLELWVYDYFGKVLKNFELPNTNNINVANDEIALDLDRFLLVACVEGRFHCWNFSKDPINYISSQLGESYIPGYCRINPQGNLLICEEFYNEETRQLIAWDLESGKPLSSSAIEELGQATPDLATLQLANSFVALPSNGGFDIYDLTRNRLILQVIGKSVTFSKNSPTILVTQQDRLVLYNLTTIKPIALFQANETILSSAISADGKLVAVLSKLGSLIVWDSETGKEIFQINNFDNPVTKILLSDKGTLTTIHLNQIKTWSIADKQLKQSIVTNSIKLTAFLSEDEQTLLLIDKTTGKAEIWNIRQGRLIKHLGKIVDPGLIEATINADGRLAAINGVIWDLKTAKPLTNSSMGYATLLPTGKVILVSINGYEVWDIDKTRLLATARYYKLGWLVYNSDGFYDGSKNSAKLLSWCLPKWPYLLPSNNDLEKQYYYPRLLSKVIK